MSTRKKKKKNYKKQHPFMVIISLFIIVYGLYISEFGDTFGHIEPVFQTSEVTTDLKVSYLDVGQADSILIQTNHEAMLIDAGNNNDGPLLVQYFNQLNITTFKYVIGTHPHEDHIGGLDNIIESFAVETIYLPDVITTTATFEEVLDAIEAKNMSFQVPKIGETWKLGEADIEVIYTGTNAKDLNSTSIILKLTFGDTKFLFTGDTTAEIEETLNNKDIQVDVLKVAHHGSKYSTTTPFLNQVNPKYAVISAGKNNSYGHPHSETLEKLTAKNIKIHRTDEEGTIIATSDGKTIEFSNIKTNVNGG